MKWNQHIGSSLADFLKEEGILEEPRAIAMQDSLARQLEVLRIIGEDSRRDGTDTSLPGKSIK